MNRRPYRMTARAEAAELTGQRIIDAMLARLVTTPYEQIRLEDVADDAGVTGQTVIRRFGSKSALMNATVERELGSIAAAREAAKGASPDETVRALVEHYERYGALILKTYSEAPQVPGLPELTARGRAYHVDWCRRAFALPPSLDVADRTRRLAQIIAICDATTWRILRFDGGLDVDDTERALGELLAPLLAEGGA
ncbi:TetR/AcrR family transcriptional regulator [Agromyces sp. PvR057]|uniref:TetR/AcrR family transcriptional regulator n=1 Tax=Agromyces sp. PvR057 TaxID=3156403 RepID=UPI0033996C0D